LKQRLGQGINQTACSGAVRLGTDLLVTSKKRPEQHGGCWPAPALPRALAQTQVLPGKISFPESIFTMVVAIA
jgi:hypothetical protein